MTIALNGSDFSLYQTNLRLKQFLKYILNTSNLFVEGFNKAAPEELVTLLCFLRCQYKMDLEKFVIWSD